MEDIKVEGIKVCLNVLSKDYLYQSGEYLYQ